MNLTTDIKTHVIITFSKSHHFITSKQNDWLIRQGKDVKFTVEGSSVTTNNIAEILTIQKYYETFPDKQPKTYGQPYSEQEPITFDGVVSQAERAFKLERLLIGMRRTANPNNPLLRKIEMRVAETKQPISGSSV